MPPVPEEAVYLLAHLFEAGPVAAGVAGSIALPWSEIDAWQRRTGVPLAPWEAQAIRRLSREYAATLHAATDRLMPPPWAGQAMTADRRKAVDQQLRNLLRGMRQAQAPKAAAP